MDDWSSKYTYIYPSNLEDVYSWIRTIETLPSTVEGRDASLETLRKYVPPITIDPSYCPDPKGKITKYYDPEATIDAHYNEQT